MTSQAVFGELSIFDFRFSIEEMTSQAVFGELSIFDFRFSIEEMTSQAVFGERYYSPKSTILA